MEKKVKLSFSHSMLCALLHCRFWLFAPQWTAACQAPLSMEILQARILEWLPCPPPGDLPNPGIEPRSLTLQADSFTDSHQGSPRILGWVAYPFSRGSSWPRNCTGVSCIVEKAMATHSCNLAWKIPWTEEPGRLQSMGSQIIGQDWAISLSLFTFRHWRRKWQPTLVFLPWESQGWGSLVGCRLWGRTELDTTEVT